MGLAYFLTLLVFAIIHFLHTIGRYITYKNILKINKYLEENKLINKIGKIEFWNERNYFLTENYMIILYNKKVEEFKYTEIKEIFKETYLSMGGLRGSGEYSEYLHIILKNTNEVVVLIYSFGLVDEEIKDITEYLLIKNKSIKVGETIKNRKFHIRIK